MIINTDYSTEMGRAVGGIVNIITKSGANDWHGTGYEYFRNNKMDATSILAAPGLNTLRQNQFGVAIGGPIQKDKTFMFANYEGQRRGESPFYNSVVLANIGDATNPAPGTINFVKKNVYGLPTEPVGLNVLRTADYDNAFARLDHNFSDHEILMLRYFINHGTLLNQSPLNDGFDLPSAFKNNRINDQSLAGSLVSTCTSIRRRPTRYATSRTPVTGPDTSATSWSATTGPSPRATVGGACSRSGCGDRT